MRISRKHRIEQLEAERCKLRSDFEKSTSGLSSQRIQMDILQRRVGDLDHKVQELYETLSAESRHYNEEINRITDAAFTLAPTRVQEDYLATSGDSRSLAVRKYINDLQEAAADVGARIREEEREARRKSLRFKLSLDEVVDDFPNASSFESPDEGEV